MDCSVGDMFVRNVVAWVLLSFLGGLIVSIIPVQLDWHRTFVLSAVVAIPVGVIAALIGAGPFSGVASFALLSVVNLLPVQGFLAGALGASVYVNLVGILFNVIAVVAMEFGKEAKQLAR